MARGWRTPPGAVDTRYFHRDHLSSVAILTDEAGTVVERLSYDAWGKRRHPNGQDDPAGALASQTTRGFTGHEQLDDVGLIHMNGRVYDPLLGRFGTPDPMTEHAFSTQGWNRYSYVGNSPLNFADPSGYCFAGCFWQKPFKALGKLLNKVPVLGNILVVAASALCGPGAPACAAAAAAATSAFVAGVRSGSLGQALRAGMISLATAGAMYGVGELTGGLGLEGVLDTIAGGHGPLASMSQAHIFNIAGHAAVGCLSAVASGGKCGPGAMAGAAGSFAGPILGDMNLNYEEGLAAHSIVGGIASVAGGGKFGDGAVTAAFGYMFNAKGLCQTEVNNGLPECQGGGDFAGPRSGGPGSRTSTSAAALTARMNQRTWVQDVVEQVWNAVFGRPSLYDSTITSRGSQYRNIRTNVNAAEFQANLEANGFNVIRQPSSGVTVLNNGQSTWTIYTRSSTGAAGAQYFGLNGSVVKYSLGQP